MKLQKEQRFTNTSVFVCSKEFCTAFDKGKKKVDRSIEEGFSWLIKSITDDYERLNDLLNTNETPNDRNKLSTGKEKK